MKVTLAVVVVALGVLAGALLRNPRAVPVIAPAASPGRTASPPAPAVAAEPSRPGPSTRSEPVLLPSPQLQAGAAPPCSAPETRELVDHGAPQSPFVHDPADRFAYKAVQATEEERRLANAAADQAQAQIDDAVELSHGTIDKSEAVTRIQKAYDDRDRALDRIFGEDRASVLRGIHLVEGVEVPDDSDAE